MNKEILRIPTRFDHRLFKDGCQIAVSTDAELTVDTDSGFADNKLQKYHLQFEDKTGF